MQYQRLGKTGLDMSIIGLGTEYLVKAAPETIFTMVRTALERGINYFDVLFANPDYRDAFGAAFAGVRDQAIITGHLPVFDSIAQCRDSFDDHLARLRTDYVDIVFVSCCDGEPRYQETMRPGGHYDLARALVEQGKARFIGFSSHTVPVAMQAVTSGAFDLLMFPINPAFDALPGETGTDDLKNLWDGAYLHQPGETDGALAARKQLYHACARRQVGLVAMKPFAAGWLFRPDLDTGFTPLNLLHYALSQPGVTGVVPGMANLEQMEQDLAYFTAPDAEKDYSAPLAKSRWSAQGACMYCSHCQPCTAGIDIAAVNQLLDNADIAGTDLESVRQAYQQLKVKASECQACANCMERCPFGVDVVNRMQRAAYYFEN